MIALLLATLLSQDVFGDGVVGPGGATLYLTAPEGGIDVVDAATGKVLKHFETSGRPIALAGEKLVVETLETRTAVLRVLDLDGKVLFTSKPVEFPEWATTRGGTRGRTFASRVQGDGTRVHYDWNAGAHLESGIPRSEKDKEAERKNASGRTSIDLDTFTVTQGPLPEEKSRVVAAREDGRLDAGGRTYTVTAKEAVGPGRPRNLRTLTSDAGWSRPLTPRYFSIPVQ